MHFKNIYDHSTFMNQSGKVFRKHSNAFAIEIITGQDSIFDLRESVMPISRAEAAKITGLDFKYV